MLEITRMQAVNKLRFQIATQVIGLVKCAQAVSACWAMITQAHLGMLIWIVITIGVLYLLYLAIKEERSTYLIPFLAEMVSRKSPSFSTAYTTCVFTVYHRSFVRHRRHVPVRVAFRTPSISKRMYDGP